MRAAAALIASTLVACGRAPAPSAAGTTPPAATNDLGRCRTLLDAHVRSGEVAFFDKDAPAETPTCCQIFIEYLGGHREACPTAGMEPPNPTTRMTIEACSFAIRHGDAPRAEPCQPLAR